MTPYLILPEKRVDSNALSSEMAQSNANLTPEWKNCI